jgi:hypothetical protein
MNETTHEAIAKGARSRREPSGIDTPRDDANAEARARVRPKLLEVVPITPPPVEARVRRRSAFPQPGEKATRYSLPASLASASPVGYRTRVALTRDEADQALALLALERPTAFAPPTERRAVIEQEVFEEASLGVLSSRQSTNFRGLRQVTVGPAESARVAALLRRIGRREAKVLDHASYTHIVLTRPYRTPFTLLLTFIGHKPVRSLLSVPLRAFDKRYRHHDDIPTIGYLQHLHLGILADGIERAAVLASQGRRRAQVFLEPFDAPEDRDALAELERMAGITAEERKAGVRIGLVAQVGHAVAGEEVALPEALCRKLGANLVAFRSERVQPGVNAEASAPSEYRARQPMDVPDALTVMAGRAAYNAFAHWLGCDRERAKDLLLLERVDVLTPNGKSRLRAIRSELEAIADRISATLPLWADLPAGRALSRNVERAKKAFALAGQRIYIGGLSRTEIEREGHDFLHAVRAFGAASARSGLYAELMGCVDLPDDCDLLAGVCVMAGPVNQNDIGKQFYGFPDLLARAFPERDPTSLLVWTLKAKTVADPIGNEEQLMNPARKGALVDLRPGPHEVVTLRRDGRFEPLRKRGTKVNGERAFADLGNFVSAPDGAEIPGNRGAPWPSAWSREVVFVEAEAHDASAEGRNANVREESPR